VSWGHSIGDQCSQAEPDDAASNVNARRSRRWKRPSARISNELKRRDVERTTRDHPDATRTGGRPNGGERTAPRVGQTREPKSGAGDRDTAIAARVHRDRNGIGVMGARGHGVPLFERRIVVLTMPFSRSHRHRTDDYDPEAERARDRARWERNHDREAGRGAGWGERGGFLRDRR
jgi:hypothetical protein